MRELQGEDEGKTVHERITYTYKVPRIEPEKKRTFWIALIVTALAITVATVLFNLSSGLPFNAGEGAVDFSIFIFASALLSVNFSPSRVSRSLGFKRISYNMALLLGLFSIPFSILEIFYLEGYDNAFGFLYFSISFVSVFAIDFFISTSWHWNRKFVDFYTPAPLRIRFSPDNEAKFERGGGFTAYEEEIARKYITGKISANKFFSILGDTPESRKLLSMADSTLRRIRERYRW